MYSIAGTYDAVIGGIDARDSLGHPESLLNHLFFNRKKIREEDYSFSRLVMVQLSHSVISHFDDRYGA